MTMTSKEIDALLKNLKDAEAIAATDLEMLESKARGAWAQAKREAAEAVAVLQDKYHEVLADRLAGIILTGSEKAQAAFVAATKANPPTTAFFVSARTVYAPLVAVVMEALNTDRMFEATAYSRMRFELGRLAESFGIEEPRIRYETDIVLQDRASVEEFVAKSVMSSDIGEKLLIASIKDQVLKVAQAIRYTETVAPVVVSDSFPCEEAVLNGLFKARVIPFNLDGTESPADSVGKAFSSLKKQLKSASVAKQNSPAKTSET